MFKTTILNMTEASIDKTDGIFRFALYFELFLLLTALFETSLLWYLLRYTSQYHRNLAMIVEQLPNQYFLSIFSRIYIIYQQLLIPNAEILHQNRPFLIAIWLRNSLLFVAFYFAPFPVFERIFATIFVQDYAIKKRRWFSYGLTTILYLVALTSAQLFMFGPSTSREMHLLLITTFNCVAFGLTFVVEIYNKKRYKQLRRDSSNYSLSVRFQLSENLNSTKPFKVMCFSIAFFASLCTTVLYIDKYIKNERTRNWVYIIFNYSCWSYGAIVPVLMLIYNKYWQREIKRLWKLVKCSSRVNPKRKRETIRKTQVRDTFGRNCFVDNSKQADVYFSQLKTDWAGTKSGGKKMSKIHQTSSRLSFTFTDEDVTPRTTNVFQDS